MTRHRVLEAALAVALVLWIAVVLGSGLAAAFMFPGMKGLAPSLPAYAAAPADWHWRIAAGTVMERIFFVADVVRFAVAPLGALLAIVLARPRSRTRPAIVRAALVAVAACLFAAHALAFAPRMNRALRAHWSAAAAGELDRAEAERDEFNRLHPAADALHSLSLAFLLPAVALAPWCRRPEAPR